MKQLEPAKGPEAGYRCAVCGATASKGMIFFECEADRVQVVEPEEAGQKPTIQKQPCKAYTCDAGGCRAHHEAEHQKELEHAKALVPPHQREAVGV